LIPLYSVKHPVGRLDVDRLRADAEVITLPPFAAGELPEAVITEAGLSISPIRRVVSEEAELLARRLYAMLPRVRITELLAEVHAWTGFAHRFTHLRNGQTAADLVARPRPVGGWCSAERTGRRGPTKSIHDAGISFRAEGNRTGREFIPAAPLLGWDFRRGLPHAFRRRQP